MRTNDFKDCILLVLTRAVCYFYVIIVLFFGYNLILIHEVLLKPNKPSGLGNVIDFATLKSSLNQIKLDTAWVMGIVFAPLVLLHSIYLYPLECDAKPQLHAFFY